MCIIMDLFSRKVISWKLSAKADAGLVMDTFKRAFEKRGAPSGLMFHSDRGSQYTSFSFRQLLDSLNVVQSFSKKGCPFDNACCECFFKYLKKEETNRRTYHSFRELQLSVFEYIDGYYNSRRPHGTLGMLTPNEAEILYREQNQFLAFCIDSQNHIGRQFSDYPVIPNRIVYGIYKKNRIYLI